MVTFRQVVRAGASIQRSVEREQKRKAKETTALFKQQQREQEHENATNALSNYENYLKLITSLHKTSPQKVNWDDVLNENQPIEPILQAFHEGIAQRQLDEYKPTFSDKLFGAKRKQEELKSKIELAKQKDIKEFQDSQNEYQQNMADWNQLQNIAIGVKSKSIQSYAEALNYFDPFSDIAELGSNVNLSVSEDSVSIEIHVNDTEVIPNNVLSITQTGKLSQKAMPKGRFFELYQDYVCSVLLRVARDIFTYLPVKIVSIDAISTSINPATGHEEELTIVSVLFPVEQFENIKFDNIDPSEAFNNFKHNMKFSKSSGFSPVQKISIPNT